MDIRIALLEDRVARLFTTPAENLSATAMREIIANGRGVEVAARHVLLPWHEVNEHLFERHAVHGGSVVTVSRGGACFRLDVKDGDGRGEAQGAWRVPLALAHDMTEAMRMADVILGLAGWRLEPHATETP